MFFKRLHIVYLLALIISACAGKNSKTAKQNNPALLSESLINANKMYVQQESDAIDQYVKAHHSEMQTSGTGLRYLIYKKANNTEQAAKGKFAKVNYKISLLDGTECYTSDKTGSKEFLIGQDQVESGLHEGILLMRVGDRAMFILPSHLAHGLMGDKNMIPPKASVVYNIELLSLK